MADGDQKGHFISYPIAALVALLAVGVLIGVGLLVWFESPRMECPKRTNQTNCVLYQQRYGTDQICNVPDHVPEPQVTEEEGKVTGLRLNTSVIPYHYDVELWPVLSGDFGLNGTVDIRVSVREQSDVIVLQVDDLTVHNDTIMVRNVAAPSQVLVVSNTEHDPSRHFYKIYLTSPLNPGRNYSIQMTFNASLIHPDWRGFYRSSYQQDGQTMWMASTQFQRSHARRAFPCFDEPAFKATFQVTLVRLSNFTTLSNMPLLRSIPRPDAPGWINDEYPTSVVMPTYLVAFVVSQFDRRGTIGPKGLPLGVWSRPAFVNYTQYALNYTGPFVGAFEQWTDIAYALPKIDQIAVPNFAAGAMENWGLITYRESALLYDPAYSDNADMRWVASVIAHELAHMWFGNLVTCAWWDDTWLNEGFATYFGDIVAMHTVMPEYKMDEFFIRRVMYIMRKDGLKSSQPVYVAGLEHHDELLKAFDIITYYKGGSILRMMQYFLTETTFRGGIQKYLKKHEFSNTVHEDLYRELQQQAVRDGTVTWDETKTNLSGIMDTWIEQMNYPLVSVSDPENGKVNVTQTRFLYDKEDEEEEEEESKEDSKEEKEKERDYFWHIPLTYATPADVRAGRRTMTWVHDKSQLIDLPALGSNDWLLVNLRLQGYYRVRYGPNTWDAIINQLNTDHTVFPVENRAGFIGDAFQLAAAKELPEVEALQTTEYLTKETEYLPFSEYRSRMGYYLNMFSGLPVYDKLERYLRHLVLPAYNRSGWAVDHITDPHLDRYIRLIAIGEACSRDYKPCVDQAKTLFSQFMNNPNHDPTPPDLRYQVYCTAVARGGNAEWDFLLSRYKANMAEVFTAYYNTTLKDALSCATAPHVVRKYLDFSLSKNDTGLFAAILGKSRTRDTAWNYITENWDNFMDGNVTRISRPAILSSVTSTWNSEGDMRKLELFMATHTDPALDKTYKAIKKTIAKNQQWLDVNLDPIQDWLTGVESKQPRSGSAAGGRARRSVSTDIVVPEKHAFHQLRAHLAITVYGTL